MGGPKRRNSEQGKGFLHRDKKQHRKEREDETVRLLMSRRRKTKREDLERGKEKEKQTGEGRSVRRKKGGG